MNRSLIRRLKWAVPVGIALSMCLIYIASSGNNANKHVNTYESNGYRQKTMKIDEHKTIRFKPFGERIPKRQKVYDKRIIIQQNGTLNKLHEWIDRPDAEYSQNVAIVTLLRDADRFLEQYGKQLMNLNYPHNLLSVYFGESDSRDNTFKTAEVLTDTLKTYHNFNHATVLKFNTSGGLFGNKLRRHSKEMQAFRRSYLAQTRNLIVHYVLQQQHFDHIIMIDVDIVKFPIHIVQQMLDAKSDVVATACVENGDESHIGQTLLYDLNSWRETAASLAYQDTLPHDELVLEGYNKSLRLYLPLIRSEGRVVSLDGVGGCALMVKADCFRTGLVFPEFPYRRHLETEGLAKMARDMGFSVVGLPFLEVHHYNGR